MLENSLIPQCKTSIGNIFDCIEDTAVKFAKAKTANGDGQRALKSVDLCRTNKYEIRELTMLHLLTFFSHLAFV